MMGAYFKLRLYKTDSNSLHEVMPRVADDFGSIIRWGLPSAEGDLRIADCGDIQTLYLDVPYKALLSGIDSRFCEEIGGRLGVPWLELRLQDGAIWDYGLLRGTELLDVFSVCPQYWESGQVDPAEMERFKGKPEILADVWGVPVDRIRNYLVNWGYRSGPEEHVFHFEREGKAYPTDESCYGDHEQFYDFLGALGGRWPTERHTLELPAADSDKGEGLQNSSGSAPA